MKDEIYDSDDDCPKCASSLSSRPCDAIGCGEDWELDDDGCPPGVCDECGGTGIHEWCRECGWDNVFKCFLSKKYEDEFNARSAAETAAK